MLDSLDSEIFYFFFGTLKQQRRRQLTF